MKGGDAKIIICQSCGESVYLEGETVIGVCSKCSECVTFFQSNT